MKKKNNKLRNIIWTISGIVLMAVFVLATTTLTNTKVSTPNINISEYIYTNLTNGSVLFTGSNGQILENNAAFYFEYGNGGKLAIGDNTKMRNMFQVVKDEGVTDIDNVKALITSRNKNTNDGTFAGFAFQTVDTDGDVYSGARIMTNFTSHVDDAVSGDLLFETRNTGTRNVWMTLKSDGYFGLNTTKPTNLFNVVGEANITGTICAKSIQLDKYGVSAYLNSSAITTTTAANTWYPVNGTFINALIEGFWLNISVPTDPSIVYNGTETQWFDVVWVATLKSDTVGTTAYFSIKNNIVYEKWKMAQYLKTANEKFVVGGTISVELAQGDKIQLIMKTDKAGAKINVTRFTTTIRESFA